LYSLLRLYWEV